jgi:hypothetical protein
MNEIGDNQWRWIPFVVVPGRKLAGDGRSQESPCEQSAILESKSKTRTIDCRPMKEDTIDRRQLV